MPNYNKKTTVGMLNTSASPPAIKNSTVDVSINSNVVIRVEDLWKEYRLGTISHKSLSKDLQSWWARTQGKEDPNSKIDQVLPFANGPDKHQPQNTGNNDRFFALSDISFDVKQGEIFGIIGRNGAGKSTLLKILSKVTAPTKGKIKIKGRMASLLEVGTGFHPELTGRENICLNGAILGMSKAEIRSKFDEIIAFAEIEKFIDTPVKRYSSGMYVRLAFAVAAHLEPEILIVDEVLAVGDAQFQKKCLGKMKEIGQEGRTVLFVSHNMGAVRNLCSRAIILNQGNLVANAGVGAVIDQYLSFSQPSGSISEVSWGTKDAPACAEIALRCIRILGPGMQVFSIYDATKPIDVAIEFQVKKPVRGMRLILSLLTTDGVVAFASTNHASMDDRVLSPGSYSTSCKIPADLLNNASYTVNVHIGQPGVKVLIQGKEYLTFNVEGSGGHGSIFTEKWPGVLAPKLNWEWAE